MNFASSLQRFIPPPYPTRKYEFHINLQKSVFSPKHQRTVKENVRNVCLFIKGMMDLFNPDS